ncbi:FMN-dependent dehydrogenase-domain-containing protein [Ochromonadaceae sp. CCMP2298]|nr:FMN-dependent dehydrogenase-domain-containing protein [Ochromonadaceae sp. CCMP2298]
MFTLTYKVPFPTRDGAKNISFKKVGNAFVHHPSTSRSLSQSRGIVPHSRSHSFSAATASQGEMSEPVGPVEEQHCAKAAGPMLNVADFERHAADTLPRNAFGYYASGATDMTTLRENRAAFDRLRLRPRVLRDVSNIDTSTTILGERVSSPICVAPTAMQRMAHPEGEEATARAAAR